MAKRLREHIGYGSLDTSALCLRSWPDLASQRYQVSFEYYDFGADIQSETLKLIEWEVSNDLKPLIGHNRRS